MEGGKLRGVFAPQEFLNSTDTTVKAYVDVFRSGQQVFRN
jgi:hypothetical protein